MCAFIKHETMALHKKQEPNTKATKCVPMHSESRRKHKKKTLGTKKKFHQNKSIKKTHDLLQE